MGGGGLLIWWYFVNIAALFINAKGINILQSQYMYNCIYMINMSRYVTYIHKLSSKKKKHSNIYAHYQLLEVISQDVEVVSLVVSGSSFGVVFSNWILREPKQVYTNFLCLDFCIYRVGTITEPYQDITTSAYNPSTWEVAGRRSKSSKISWATFRIWVQGQPGLCEILCRQNKNKTDISLSIIVSN